MLQIFKTKQIVKLPKRCSWPILILPQPVRAGDNELRARGRVRGRGAGRVRVPRRLARRRAHDARARAAAEGLRGQAARLLQEAGEQGIRARTWEA